jgi:hypothetical protein
MIKNSYISYCKHLSPLFGQKMETDEYMCPLYLLYLEGCTGCSLLCASTSKIHYILSIATLCPGVVEGLGFNVGLLSCTACQ